MKTIIFTNARDEENLLEWVHHHLNSGFSHIHIFDHLSVNPIKNLIINPQVTVERCDDSMGGIKFHFINSALAIAREQNYDWMLYLDSDEFLVLNSADNVTSFLDNYANFDQIGINWLLFGSNYLDILEPGKTLLESFTKSEPNFDLHIKTFLNLRRQPNITGIPNPHVYILNDMTKSVGVDFQKLDPVQPWFFSNKENYTKVNAFIAHYIYQSFDIYYKRKCLRPRDDVNLFHQILNKDDMHRLHNVINNDFVFKKYDKRNKFSMNPSSTLTILYGVDEKYEDVTTKMISNDEGKIYIPKSDIARYEIIGIDPYPYKVKHIIIMFQNATEIVYEYTDKTLTR